MQPFQKQKTEIIKYYPGDMCGCVLENKYEFTVVDQRELVSWWLMNGKPEIAEEDQKDTVTLTHTILQSCDDHKDIKDAKELYDTIRVNNGKEWRPLHCKCIVWENYNSGVYTGLYVPGYTFKCEFHNAIADFEDHRATILSESRRVEAVVTETLSLHPEKTREDITIEFKGTGDRNCDVTVDIPADKKDPLQAKFDANPKIGQGKATLFIPSEK